MFAATISAPNLTVAVDDPNFAKYPIPISISGGENLALFDLAFQVGDGGGSGSETIGIHSVDFLTGTIFSGKTVSAGHSPTTLPTSESRLVASLSTNPIGNVVAEGLLATIYLDLTGATLGWRAIDVNVSNLTGAYDASFSSPLNLSFVHGSIEIVPEPNGVQLALAGAGFATVLILLASRRMKQERRAEVVTR